MADCSFGDLACYGQSLASSAIGNAIDNMAKAVQEAFGKAVASLGTIWVNIGTPNLTGGDAPSIAAGTSAPNSEGITTVLGYVTWVSLAICGIAMIILGMIVASRLRSGQGIAAVGRAGIILGAVIFKEIPGAFSDACNKAIQNGLPRLLRDDWLKVFDHDEIAESIRRIT